MASDPNERFDALVEAMLTKPPLRVDDGDEAPSDGDLLESDNSPV
jgi:hypothetical protein